MAYATTLDEVLALRSENAKLRAALKPFAELAERREYTLDDVPHGLMIDAKLALRGLRIVGGLVEQPPTTNSSPSPTARASTAQI